MIEKYLSLIEDQIKNQKFESKPKSLYDPIRYIMNIGGKRLRPLLTLLSYSLYKKDVEKIVPYAIAVEAFHNFTLMHDDIMDQALIRRGKKTVHEKWNVSTAILSGDVMLVKVYDMFSSLKEEKLKKIVPLFNQCAVEVCEGQQWDMEFETRSDVDENKYIEMIRLKTAVLLGFSLELGAILADAPVKDQQLLRDFGVNIGIGFQLKDDLLDVFADKKKFGKKVGGDIVANKKTFLLINALKRAKGIKKQQLQKWISHKNFDHSKKIEAVTKIYQDLEIKSLTEQRMNFYFDQGVKNLHKVSASKKTESLLKFTQGLMDRQS